MSSSPDAEQLDNPLNIDHILMKIMKLSCSASGTEQKNNLEILKKLRLVSRQWNAVASEIIRESDLYWKISFQKGSDLKKYTKIMDGNRNPIYSKFRIYSEALAPDPNLCYDFFKTCGWFIKSLTLDFGYGHLKKPIGFDTKNPFFAGGIGAVLLPNLQNFEYEYCNYDIKFSAKEEAKLHKLFAAILNQTSDQLKSLTYKFASKPHEQVYDHLEFPPKILCFPADRKWEALDSLHLDIGLVDSFLADLSKCNPGLKPRKLTLHVSNCGSSTDPTKHLTEFLASQAKTLVQLNLIEQVAKYVIQFPPGMIALKGINFNDIYGATPFIKFETFEYGTHLPALTTVKLSTCSDQADWLPFFSSKSSTMESMHLPTTSFTDLNLAWSLHSTFPNLTELCVGLGGQLKYQKILETIFSTMGKKLKSLKIFGFIRLKDVRIDHILTGFSKEDCRQFRRERLFLNKENVQGIPRKPSLIDLQLLENFELTRQPPMDFLRESTPYFVSDVTGYLAFLQMDNLKRIKIINNGMTETCLNLLKGRLDVETEVIQIYMDGAYRDDKRAFSYDDYDSPTPDTYYPCFEEGDDE